jgi:hypothetical protein
MSITKKIKICCEEAYVETIWCKQLLGGLIKELKKRRLVYEQSDQIEGDDYVVLLGMNREWVKKSVCKCNEKGITPIVLSNQSKYSFAGQAHLVCPDIQKISGEIKAALEAAGRNKAALYASSRSADLDRDRTEIFSNLIQKVNDVYPNNGSLEKCFRSFLPKASMYDAVICTNGYAAVSLVKKLEKENAGLLEKMVILTFEEVLKHSKYNDWISFVDLNLESYGAMAVQLLDMISQKNDISEITVEMKCSLCEIDHKIQDVSEIFEEDAELYEDPEIVHMAKIEQLLRDADDLDHHIIAMLLDGATYGEVADRSYMTEGNVKYRVKKYMSICGCTTKKELLELLQEYLQ